MIQALRFHGLDKTLRITIQIRTAGREAATHEVYFSSDRQAVADGTVSPASIPAGTCQASYGPLSLELGKTYYWKVNEVNLAEEPNTWEGDVWSFSTPEYVLVEDFEGYSDDPGDEVFATWIEGYGVSGNGSQISHNTAPWLENANVHGGSWSAPYYFDNTGTVVNSEVTRTFSSPQDWTAAGIRALTLFFYGQAGNTTPSAGEQMYVKLNGVKVAYDGDMADITQEQWHEWGIDLASFGVNLQNVTTISIGFDRGASAASGLVCFDDIRLYPSKCILSRRSAEFAKADYVKDCIIDCKEVAAMAENWLLAPADPGAGNLVGWWKFDGDTLDYSGLGNDGTANGVPTYAVGKVGQAMSFDGTDDYVAIDGVADDITSNDITLAAWVNMTADDDWYPVISCNTSGGGNVGWLAVNDGYADFGSVTGTMFVTDNDWHHLAYTRIGDSGSLYVDGVLEGTHTASGTSGADPTNQGFDINIGGSYIGGPDGDYFLPWNASKHPGLEEHPAGTYITDALTIEANEQIDQAVTDGVPFFMNMAHYAVHAPLSGQGDPEFLGQYGDRPNPEDDYAAMLESMDASLGSILDNLEQEGIADNTIVIFYSDNGGLSNHSRTMSGSYTIPGGSTVYFQKDKHNLPINSGKGSGYEGGIRVPCIVAWAGQDPCSAPIDAALAIVPGTVSGAPLISDDLFPTILKMAGIQNLQQYTQNIDGMDLTPILNDADSFDPNRPIYTHYPHQWWQDIGVGLGIEPYTSIRKGDWKLIYFYGDGYNDDSGYDPKVELYDLVNDIGETNNLVSSESPKATELITELKNWMVEVGAQTPVSKATGQPVPLPDVSAL